MKKLILIFSLCICILGLTACENQQQEDVLHLGVNAIITEIDTASKTITVKDSDDNGVLGSECTLECSKVPMIYCNYDTGEVDFISFEDLQIDDEILLGIRSSEIEKAKSQSDNIIEIKVEQIQLATQRLSKD